MTISGILSGVVYPAGLGYVLSRAAARIEPTAAPQPRQPAADLSDSRERTPDAAALDAEVDIVELSPAARRWRPDPWADSAADQAAGADEQQQARLRDLRRRDEQVRQHEQAHLSAAGAYARGGARYEYETGPDGERYAVSGEVDIDTAPIPGDPEATIRKMEIVRAAALAPADPSAQDLQVAAKAARAIERARAEIARRQAAAGRAGAGAADVSASSAVESSTAACASQCSGGSAGVAASDPGAAVESGCSVGAQSAPDVFSAAQLLDLYA